MLEMVTALPVNFNDLKESMDERTAILTYWISKNELILWLITGSEIISRSIPIDEKTVSNMVESARKAIQSNSMDRVKLDMSRLYTVLIGSVEEKAGEIL